MATEGFEAVSSGTRTSERAQRVLSALDRAGIPGLRESERGSLYRVYVQASKAPGSWWRRALGDNPAERLGPVAQFYTPGVGAGLSILIVFVALIASAFAVPFILVLLLAPLPLLPLLAGAQHHIAVSAIEDEDGATQVTVHGHATAATAAAVEVFLQSLPSWVPPPEPEPPGMPSTVASPAAAQPQLQDAKEAGAPPPTDAGGPARNWTLPPEAR